MHVLQELQEELISSARGNRGSCNCSIFPLRTVAPLLS